MIDCAERLRRRLDEAGRSEGGAVEFLVNERSDLSCFGAGVFDLVVTHICLQHMPWALAAGYVREFGRVCQPGGVVAFQVPSRLRRSPSGAVLRQRLVDSLPFNLGAWYRRWRHGSAHVFEMHYTPPEEVICVAAAAGLSLLHQEPDGSSGPATEGFIYLFRRGAAGERE
jgi:SAM-dependent methyltransferase